MSKSHQRPADPLALAKSDGVADQKRSRHGFRGVPAPPVFDFDALPDGALLNEYETAAVGRWSDFDKRLSLPPVRDSSISFHVWIRSAVRLVAVAPTPRGDTKTLARLPRVSSAINRPVAVPSACLQVAPIQPGWPIAPALSI